MTTIAIANQKGGVGKTTSTIEIGAALKTIGRKVLLIDLDQQCNMSSYVDAGNETPTIYDVLHATCPIADSLQHLEYFDIIQASKSLSRADREFVDMGDNFLLSDVIDVIEENKDGVFPDYDYVLIDNSPSRSILLNMSYSAADYIIIPTECDSGSLDGVAEIKEDLEKVRSGKHPISHAQILCILLTKYENTTMHRMALDNVKQMADNMEEKPFVTTVHKAIKVSETKLVKSPLIEYAAGSRPAADYIHAAQEIDSRVRENH